MLFLTFQLGEEWYALDAASVAEVLPFLLITRLPHALTGVAGIANYHGSPTPVIDLSELITGRAAERRLNTRIIFVRYRNDDGSLHLLGLIAERATATLRLDPADFAAAGITNPAAGYLGPIAMHAGRLIQRVEVNELLPPSLREALFSPT